MNHICLIGNLTKAPTLRYTASGKPVVNGRIAVDHYTGGKTRTDYFDFVVWGKRAEALVEHMPKGSKIAVTGALCTDGWTDKDGNKRYNSRVEVDTLDFLVKAGPRTDDDQGPSIDPADQASAQVELTVVPN